MNRGILVLILLLSLCGAKFGLEAQGVVSFSNLNAPFSSPDGLLGAGYTARLRTISGTMIGAPASFLINGFFAGGSREIPNQLPGSTIELELVIQGFEGLMWVSQPFEVILGDKENPGFLTGLEPAMVGGVVSGSEVCFARYCWSVGWAFPGHIDCVLGGGILAHVPVDDGFCEGIPYPGDPERTPVPPSPPVPSVQEANGGIRYSLFENGKLELRWPVGATLMRSGTLGERDEAVVVRKSSSAGGRNVRFFSTRLEDKHFFWLAE